MSVSEANGSWAAASAIPDLGVGFVLDAIACSKPGWCEAVGSVANTAGGSSALAISYVHGVWGTPTAIVLPSGLAGDSAGDAKLSSVACTAPERCVAVGTISQASSSPYVDYSDALVVMETDGSWQTASQPPVPGDADASGQGPYSYLDSVSCPAAGVCAAVGGYVRSRCQPGAEGHPACDYGAMLDLAYSGGSWTTAGEIGPPDADDQNHLRQDELTAVTCTSVGNCLAGGHYSDASNTEAVMDAIQHNGVWSTQASALPVPTNAGETPSSPGSEIDTVACDSSSSCLAAGSYTDNAGAGQGMILAAENGVWDQANKLALPPGAASDPHAAVLSISCPAAGTCAAVGQYDDRVGNSQALVITSPVKTPSTATRLVLANLKQSATRWRETKAPSNVARHRRPLPVGTRFTFTLSRPARLTLTFYQRITGHEHHRACVPGRGRDRHAARCIRWNLRGRITMTEAQGHDSIRFAGRLNGHTKLRPGTYRLNASAAAGTRHSAAPRLRFTIVK
jgi:hypothetical protein